MLIGELVEATGVSRRLLRYYERQGLLRPTRRANGYREYASSDVERVRRIRGLLAARLPTAVIAQLVDCVEERGGELVPSRCPGMVVSLEERRSELAAQVSDLQASIHALTSLLAAAGDEAAHSG